jgi:hypothetical protein
MAAIFETLKLSSVDNYISKHKSGELSKIYPNYKIRKNGKKWSFKGFDGSELEGRSIRSGRGVIH